MKKYTTTLVGLLLTATFLAINPAARATIDSKLTEGEVASIALVANYVSINYGKIAKAKSTNKVVLRFAETMINDHMNLISSATAINSKLAVAPKDNAISQKLLNDAAKITKELRSKSGRAFDKAYIENEIAYHKFVIKRIETELIPETTNAEMRTLLENILSSFKSHLQYAITIQNNMSKS